MSNVIRLPVIAGVEITTDPEGRFNLNALHRASGSAKKDGPSYWLALGSTKALVKELESQTTGIPVVTLEGRDGGTFAHELLAVSYAGWISPAFHLKVNQVFLDFRSGKYVPTNQRKLGRKELAQMVLDAEEEAEVLRLENHHQSERIEKLENFFQKGMTIAAFGKTLNGINCMKLNDYCMNELNWLYNESRSGNTKRYRVRSNARDKYLTETDREIGVHGDNSFMKFEPKLLKEGAQKLYSLYLAGQLPMKKTWNGEFVHFKFGAAA